jgi:uncharacterized protein GlcG (DUF336 family)
MPVPVTQPDPSELTAADVQAIVQRAAASVSDPLVITVTSRAGNILAVFRERGAPVTATGNFSATVDANELSVSLARTASFFSNDQAPLSSRTVRYISGIHFPPGIAFTGNAALYGIENTNRGCPFNTTFALGQAVPPARSIDGSTTGLGVATGKKDIVDSDPNAVNPGGVPIFKNAHVVGGIGVVADRLDVAEYAAFAGSIDAANGFTPVPVLKNPGVVIIDGVALPFVNQTAIPSGVIPNPAASSGPISGTYLVGPKDSPGPVPDGDLVTPQAGAGGLTQQDVTQIVTNAVNTANTTRAVIRLPDGSRARMAIAVADLNGNLLTLHRMPDATVFSIDVAVAKSRNVIYFSGTSRTAQDLPGVPSATAVTNRTISFGAQPLFPPGIDGSGAGPFFTLYQFDSANPCTQGAQPANSFQSGIVFFPGSAPLYKNGVLVGGLGISGDGVEQDDFVTAGGSVGFEAAAPIRADQIFEPSTTGPVRLPYLKFPRDPTAP